MAIDPALLGAGLQAATSIISSGVNYAATTSGNRKARKFAEHMYHKQREDALKDWNMQNEYNHPLAIRQRMIEAGINPALLYGKSPGELTAGAVRSSQAANPSWVAPQVDLRPVGSAMSAYYDAKLAQQNLNNLEAQRTLTQMEAMLRVRQAMKMDQDRAMSEFDLQQKQELKQVYQETQKAGLDKLLSEIQRTEAETQTTLDRNDREAAMNKANLQVAAESILNSRQNRLESMKRMAKTDAEIEEINARIDFIKDQREQIKADTMLRNIEIDWNSKGYTKNDWWIWRKLQELTGGLWQNENEKNRKWFEEHKEGLRAWQERQKYADSLRNRF